MISSFLIIPGFQKIENDSSIEAANRAVDAINNRVSQLNLKASDWANWDDTYDFMKDHNKKYISSNLQNQTLANLGIDYMMFFDTNNKMLDMKHVNIDSPDLPSLPLEQGVKDLFGQDSLLLKHSSLTDDHAGIIDTPQGIIMITSRPILTSNVEGPSRGTLVFAQYLDASVQQELADLTHLKLTYLPANDSVVTKSVPAYTTHTSRGTQWVSQLSDTRARAYASILDIYGKPSIATQVDLARTISQQGVSSMNTSRLFTLLAGLLIVITTAILLNWLIVSRIIDLSRRVAGLKDVQDSSQTVVVSGNDELSCLGAAINDLLVRLHNTYDLRQANTTLEEKVTARTKELDDQLEQMKRTNDLMIDRELKMKELKQQNAKLRAENGDDSS